MKRDDFLNKYWSYYLLLENKTINILNYVEMSEENYNTYSKEFVAIIQAIGAELDAFFKVFCGISYDDRTATISSYAKYILSKYADLIKMVVVIKEKDIELKPFEGWNVEKAAQSLPWWQSFDHIKHSRTFYLKEASLKNCIYILAALYLLEMKYVAIITNNGQNENLEPDIPDKSSSLFQIKGYHSRFMNSNHMIIEANVGERPFW